MLEHISNVKYICEPRVYNFLNLNSLSHSDLKRMNDSLNLEDINKIDIFTKTNLLIKTSHEDLKNLKSLLIDSIMDDYSKADFTGKGCNLQFLGHETNLLLPNHIKHLMTISEFKDISNNICISIAQIMVDEMKDVLKMERDTVYLVTFDDGYEELATVEVIQEELEAMSIEPENCFRSVEMDGPKIRRTLSKIKENLINKDIIDYIILSTIINIEDCETLSKIADAIINIMRTDLGVIINGNNSFDIYLELCSGF